FSRDWSSDVCSSDLVDLSRLPTRSEEAWSGTKAEGKERVKELARQLADLQELFYADGRQRLLVVLQAMDTAGKDTTIRDVFGRRSEERRVGREWRGG